MRIEEGGEGAIQYRVTAPEGGEKIKNTGVVKNEDSSCRVKSEMVPWDVIRVSPQRTFIE